MEELELQFQICFQLLGWIMAFLCAIKLYFTLMKHKVLKSTNKVVAKDVFKILLVFAFWMATEYFLIAVIPYAI